MAAFRSTKKTPCRECLRAQRGSSPFRSSGSLVTLCPACQDLAASHPPWRINLPGGDAFPVIRVHTPKRLPVYWVDDFGRVRSIRDIFSGVAGGLRIQAVYNSARHIIRGELNGEFVGLDARVRLRELAAEDYPRLEESHEHPGSSLAADAWEYLTQLGYVPTRSDELSYILPGPEFRGAGQAFISRTFEVCFPGRVESLTRHLAFK